MCCMIFKLRNIYVTWNFIVLITIFTKKITANENVYKYSQLKKALKNPSQQIIF